MSEVTDRHRFVAELRAPEGEQLIRESRNGEEFTLTGYAAVFDKWSEDLWTFAGTFREKIAPGAFTEALERKPDVRLLFNHDGLTLARTKSNTLELSEDEEGLRVWARLSPEQQVARDLRFAMLRGDVDQMSFAFTIAEDVWDEDDDGEEVERTILRVDELFDVSVVSFPAYPDTEATVRELRSAADAGKIAARAETDPEAEQSDPEAVPADEQAAPEDGDGAVPAETDPADPEDENPEVDEAAERKAVLQQLRESQIRLRKELAKWE